ncbi:methanethiol oxidase [Prorops nasuta]|uniref:methanethiol oxidase n=1 Tax=Prorops nasuta TaxID=863751 RepID=UPI0034CEE10E
MAGKPACCSGGPGYKSPKAAMQEAPRETIMYVVCPHTDPEKADVLCTVDIDPQSPTYCQIIHKLRMPNVGDELHHSGWNACSSCHGTSRKRDTMVLPSLMSDRVYLVDVTNEKTPTIKKVIEPEEMHKHNLSTPHTSHCAPNGDIMISTMGKPNGDGQGEFFLIDSETHQVKGTWTSGTKAKYGYDFWYQPYHDVLVASEWGVPRIFKKGYRGPADSEDPNIYGRSLNFYSWSERTLKSTINLGIDGIAPLEIRFLHEPTEKQGYVGCAVNSTIFGFYKNEDNTWSTEKVIKVSPKIIINESGNKQSIDGMITDILISLDDKYLYFSNFMHGDVRQYDITDRHNPKLVGQIFLGGKLLSNNSKIIEDPEELEKQPDPIHIKGRKLFGSPQMLQLSLDGKRLYVSSSLFSVWDKQFYPDHVTHGSTMIKLDVDTVKGGLTLDKNFLVDFGADKDDILLAHEMRYPGGDCTSDIWLPEV